MGPYLIVLGCGIASVIDYQVGLVLTLLGILTLSAAILRDELGR